MSEQPDVWDEMCKRGELRFFYRDPLTGVQRELFPDAKPSALWRGEVWDCSEIGDAPARPEPRWGYDTQLWPANDDRP